MRLAVMFIFIAFGIFMGLLGGIEKPKKKWWMLFVIFWVALASFLTLSPPLGGSFADAQMVADIKDKRNVDVALVADPSSFEYHEEGYWFFQGSRKKHLFEVDVDESKRYDLVWDGKEIPEELKSGKEVIVELFYLQMEKVYFVNELKSVEPILSYPFVPALLQRIRNLNFHVPMSWVAVIAFLISMIFSIKYLSKGNYKDDLKAASAITIGLLFTILATTTGMVWAKFNWGTYWNNDPRQITILVIMIIYFAYLILRSSIEDENKKARLSSVYSILSFITVPFLFFIIPRQFASLHPGAKDDGTTGPVIDTQTGMLDSELALTYYISLAGFIIIFFWLFSLYTRYKLLEYKQLD